MSAHNELLREGIISKLKEYDAFIDNELPDYIMVMLANHKTIHQINNDLKLFLGGNTERFTTWLQGAVTSPHELDPEQKEEAPPPIPEQEVTEEEEEAGEVHSPPPPPVGTKRKRSEREEVISERLPSEKEEEEKPSPPKMIKTSTEEYKNSRESTGMQRVKVVAEDIGGQRSRMTGRKATRTQPEPTRDQDLRELIARRREEKGMTGKKHAKREREEVRGRGAEVEEGGKSTVSSVVKLVERPSLSDQGGSRLLQRAILGISGRKGGRLRVKKSTPVTLSSQKRAATVAVKHSTSKDVPKSSRVSTATVDSDHEEDEVDKNFVDEFREEQLHLEAKEKEEEEEKEEEAVEVEEMEEQEEEEKETEAVVTKKVIQVIPVRVDTRRGQSVKGGGVEGAAVEVKRDLRELLSKSKENKSTRFVVTLDSARDQYQHVDTSMDQANQEDGEEWEEDTGEGGRGGGLPERCRFWPNCKNGDSCPYHHPSAHCKLFPNCKFGNKCLFIHPQCKFDARCTRADCPYLHTAPRHLMFKQQQVPAMPPVMFTPSFKPKNYSYSRGGGHQSSLPWQRSSKFPNKSALTWTPKKSPHISQRQFAVPEDRTTSLHVT